MGTRQATVEFAIVLQAAGIRRIDAGAVIPPKAEQLPTATTCRARPAICLTHSAIDWLPPPKR